MSEEPVPDAPEDECSHSLAEFKLGDWVCVACGVQVRAPRSFRDGIQSK